MACTAGADPHATDHGDRNRREENLRRAVAAIGTGRAPNGCRARWPSSSRRREGEGRWPCRPAAAVGSAPTPARAGSRPQRDCRADFGLRDPYRANDLRRCMPCVNRRTGLARSRRARGTLRSGGRLPGARPRPPDGRHGRWPALSSAPRDRSPGATDQRPVLAGPGRLLKADTTTSEPRPKGLSGIEGTKERSRR